MCGWLSSRTSQKSTILLRAQQSRVFQVEGSSLSGACPCTQPRPCRARHPAAPGSPAWPRASRGCGKGSCPGLPSATQHSVRSPSAPPASRGDAGDLRFPPLVPCRPRPPATFRRGRGGAVRLGPGPGGVAAGPSLSGQGIALPPGARTQATKAKVCAGGFRFPFLLLSGEAFCFAPPRSSRPGGRRDLAEGPAGGASGRLDLRAHRAGWRGPWGGGAPGGKLAPPLHLSPALLSSFGDFLDCSPHPAPLF